MKNIIRLAKPEHAGDWHDRPLRWAYQCGGELQKLSTLKEALLYRRIRRSSAGEAEAIRRYAAS